ncbi:MAG: phenylacetate--CoA ligase [Desulfobacca sp.]|nr:phenylacetate--CoA ligase [Desulfobacca sp.]
MVWKLKKFSKKAVMKNRIFGYFDPRWETQPIEEKRPLIEQRLRETLLLAYAQAPAIKHKFDQEGLRPEEIQTVKDLERIPITKKAELVGIQKENPPFGGLLTLAPNQLKRIFVSPGPIFDPMKTGTADSRCCKCLFAAGIRTGDIVQNTFMYHFTPFGHYFDDALVSMDCTVIPAGVGNTELQAQVMQALKVNGYIGTPSFLKTILDKVVELGYDLQKDLALKVAVVGAEMLSESLRQDFETKVGMMVRQAYGTADVGLIGHECSEKKGYHLFDEELLFEIVDPTNGKQMPVGEIGELVVTSFNPVYPLLRFGTGDLTSIDEGPCTCGRTSFRLPRLLGRVDQVTKVRAMFIHPNQVDWVVEKNPLISRCQVVVSQQNHQDEMTFVIELADEGIDRESLKRKLKEDIREMMRLRGEVQFVPSGTIPEDVKKIVDNRAWD